MHLRQKDLYGGATSVGPHPDTDPLRRMFSEKREALSDAATLLSGARGAALVTKIVDGLQRDVRIGRGTADALGSLSDILMLAHVDDPTRLESVLFSRIDPASPDVENICLLADELRDAMIVADAAPATASRARDIA